MLEAVANMSGLKAVDVGFSSACSRKGLMSLARLTGLQCLSVTGMSAHDFGSLSADDVAKLACMPKLAVLEVRRRLRSSALLRAGSWCPG